MLPSCFKDIGLEFWVLQGTQNEFAELRDVQGATILSCSSQQIYWDSCLKVGVVGIRTDKMKQQALTHVSLFALLLSALCKSACVVSHTNGVSHMIK